MSLNGPPCQGTLEMPGGTRVGPRGAGHSGESRGTCPTSSCFTTFLEYFPLSWIHHPRASPPRRSRVIDQGISHLAIPTMAGTRMTLAAPDAPSMSPKSPWVRRKTQTCSMTGNQQQAARSRSRKGPCMLCMSGGKIWQAPGSMSRHRQVVRPMHWLVILLSDPLSTA